MATATQKPDVKLEVDGPEEKTPPYRPKAPSSEELRAAREVANRLKKPSEIGADNVISALVAIVDVIDPYKTPTEWPGKEDEEYSSKANDVLEAIARALEGGIRQVVVNPNSLAFLWRNKEKWTSKGETVRGKAVSLNTRSSFLAAGIRGVVEINFHHWLTLNPLQKVFTLYRELRRFDVETKTSRPPDFVGYFDELDLFGSRVFRDMVELESRMKGSEADHPYQLSIFNGEGGEHEPE